MLATLLLAAAAAAGVPSVDRVEPSTLEAYRPVELTIVGGGFSPECRVLIGAPGRLAPVRHELVGDGEIRVHLTAGYGPDPARRQVVVECGRNFRSVPVAIEIVRGKTEEAEPAPPAERAAAEPRVDSEIPTVTRLEPAAIDAGQVFTLTVMGGGFVDGAEVEIFANSHAGSSHPPAYEMLRFAAEVASDTVLLVDLDRGFAASPRLRQVVVINPDGGTSAPVYLEIKRSSP
jgi:hypothetical protein